jgi:uncharacterized lipoprotein YddW (UPF0748 family)
MRYNLLATVITLILTLGNGTVAEMRGAWVTAWSRGLRGRAEVDATVEAAKKAGIRSLFVQVRKTADAYYEPAIEPLGEKVEPGFDPLAYMLERAHKEGIKVHAWVVVFRAWKGTDYPADPNHLVNKHPEWLTKDVNGAVVGPEGIYIDPGVPEARTYLANVVGDIARRYKVDGIHLDYFRYPGADWGYNELSLTRFNKLYGRTGVPESRDSQWRQWRRQQVMELLRMIHRRVRAVRPRAVVSVATIAWGACPDSFEETKAYGDCGQDWVSWARKGYLDANIPMNYKPEGNAQHAKEFRKWLMQCRRWGGKMPTYCGIDVCNNSPKHVAEQIKAVREAGLPGYVLFSFNESSERDGLVEMLSKLNSRR